MPEPIIIALIAAAAGLLGAIVNGFFARRKLSADAASTLTSASIDLVETLRGEVDDLRSEQGKLKDEIEKLKAEIESIEIISDAREKKINALKARIDEANKIIDAQEKRIAHLEKILRDNGIDPPRDLLDEDIGGVVF